jgi:hypothetical protein
VAYDDLWVKYEQGTAKQWWPLQEPHICEFKTWIMINIVQVQLGKIFVPIHVLLIRSFGLHSSPVANDGLWVKLEQATANQWWALQQSHICEFKT